VVAGSETNRRGPAVFRAAAEAARGKRFSGQYTTAEISHTSWSCERQGVLRPRMLRAQEDPRGRAADGCRCRSYGKSRAAEPGMSEARKAGTSRFKELGNTTQEKAPEGDVKSSRLIAQRLPTGHTSQLESSRFAISSTSRSRGGHPSESKSRIN
jgi:hypothetical protein